MTTNKRMAELAAKIKAQAVTALAFHERSTRERLGARFGTGAEYQLDGSTDVRQQSDSWLSIHAQRSWDSNQIDDLRKCNLELAKRYVARSAS